jgi:ABC-type dipeptide/oligopeptide/nickel transport system permease component
MVQMILNRFLRALLVMAALVVLTFVMSRAFADPVALILGDHYTEEGAQALRASMGLDKPLPQQFVDYIVALAHGDLGLSTWQRRPAVEIVASRIVPTFLLAITACLLAATVGLVSGFLAGTRPGSRLDRGISVTSAVCISAPDFWIGIMLILFLAVNIKALPTSGYGGPVHFILPALTLALKPAARLMQVTRDSVIGELRKDYVVAAQARGMTRMEVLRRQVLKNVTVPTTTLIGYDAIMMMAGFASVEVVFNWPGIGNLAIQAVLNQDVVLVSAIVIVTGLIVTVGNALIDVGHLYIDRRLSR